MKRRAFIGLGANLGDPLATLVGATDAIAAEVGRLVARSSFYRTAPWGLRDQPPFINAVVEIETALEPLDLLAALKRIERALGRVPGERWGPRAIDLDILIVEGVKIESPALTLPHRHLAERAFVLVPLAEIAPAFASLRDALPSEELGEVERLADESLPPEA